MGSFLLGVLGGCCLSGGVLLLLSAPEKKGSRKAQIPAMISSSARIAKQKIKWTTFGILKNVRLSETGK